jgi:hypothetical protein
MTVGLDRHYPLIIFRDKEGICCQPQKYNRENLTGAGDVAV